MSRFHSLPSVWVATACAVSAVLPACSLADAPVRAATPHPAATPAPIVVPADAKYGFAAFSLQLGPNWARSNPKTPDAAIGRMPSFVRRDPKTGKDTANLSVVPVASPPKSLVDQAQSLFHLKKNGKPYMKLMHWGRFTAGMLYYPHFPDGSARLTATVLGPSTIADIFAEYPRPVTSADKQEFVAIVKSLKLLNAK